MKLKDKVAIVTGGAKGLGREFCTALARQGASIAVIDVADPHEVVAQISSQGGVAKGIEADITNPRAVAAAVAETVRTFGKIDILVNNAAIVLGLVRKPFYEIDPVEWDKTMAVNLKGPWLCTKAVFPYMREQKKGKIINLASETFFTGSHGFVHYVASKGGVVGLTRSLAIELGPHNITINAIAPGFTDSESSRSLADVTRYDTTKTPMGRLMQAPDLFGALIFFASEASDFITGQVLLVDGGRVMH
ncbi:MAG: glucose 1-dehydrogenase [Syntrophobacteraceae bacterium]|nr:glucose 1-dehydrogenase [Syntrophobacteraceae bacterium]